MTAQLKEKVILHSPTSDENPVAYAARLSEWYSSQPTESQRKKHGIFFTPEPVAHHMGRLCRNGAAHFVRIVDPAAGTGILAAAACAALANHATPPRHIELVCYEIERSLASVLERSLNYLQSWLSARRIQLRYRVVCEDFLLANAPALEPGLLPAGSSSFDAVICNPPYFKIPKSDPRAMACSSVVHGQPNIYGLFMATGSALLREGGRFVFITPRSYASGSYFARLREYFFKSIRLTDLHVFESRKDAFENVLQEAAITAGTRSTGWERKTRGLRVRLSSSSGAIDVGHATVRTLPLTTVVSDAPSGRILSFPITARHGRITTIVNGWTGSLQEYGWRVSTGPVVAFRAKEYLREKEVRSSIPLLWLQNVRRMEIRWPLAIRKAQFFLRNASSQKLVVPNSNYVILRRFSAKEESQRVTAAPYVAEAMNQSSGLALENHLNYIYKLKGGLTEDDVYGLAALLNSDIINTYFRISNGNTQVNAAELRSLRLPSESIIRRIGRRVRRHPDQLELVVGEETGYVG